MSEIAASILNGFFEGISNYTNVQVGKPTNRTLLATSLTLIYPWSSPLIKPVAVGTDDLGLMVR